MTTVLVIRHGRTALNADGALRGRVDVPLDEVGLAEAAQLGDLFEPVPLTVVVCSPLACRRPQERRGRDRQHHPARGIGEAGRRRHRRVQHPDDRRRQEVPRRLQPAQQPEPAAPQSIRQ